MTRFHLSRRTALRGGAFALGLPLLDAMLDDRGLLVGRAQAAVPVRFLTWFWPNGTRLSIWNKTPVGPLSAGTLSPCLSPFAPVAGQPDVLPYLNQVSGLDHRHCFRGGHNGAPFAVGTVHKVGINASRPEFDPLPDGSSLDQICADKLGAATRVRSVAVAVNWPGGLNGHVISWRDGGRAVTPISDKWQLYKMLAGADTTAPAAVESIARRRSVLDFVAADAQRLRARVGATDRARVDEHLTAVRELEKELTAPAAPASCSLDRAPFEAGAKNDMKHLLTLMVQLFKCDVTRFGSFLLDRAGGQYSYEGGPKHGDHDTSHNDPDPVVVTVTQGKMKLLAGMLRQMAAIPEGTGTMLDNFIVFSGSEIGDGRLHSNDSMPVLVAGRAGGKLRAGRRIAAEGKVLNDLFCSLLNYAGVDTPVFGLKGAGPLAGF